MNAYPPPDATPAIHFGVATTPESPHPWVSISRILRIASSRDVP